MAIATPPQIVTRPASSSAVHPATGVVSSVLVHAAAFSLAFASGWSPQAELVVQRGEAATPNQMTLQISAAPVASAPPVRLEAVQPEAAAAAAAAAEDRAPVDVGRLIADTPPVAPIESLQPPERETQETPAEAPSDGEETAKTQDKTEMETTEETDAAEAQAAAVPQIAGAERVGAAVDSLPRTVESNQPPAFPPAALAERRGGKVVLRVAIAADGRVGSLSVLQSSGHADLDGAAVEAVRRWKFIPAKRDGRGVAYEIAVPIRFTFDR